jgi:hypothetical protein
MIGLGTILGFITGLAGPISAATQSIADLKKARVVADSDQERARIDAQLHEAEGRKAVLVAEAGHRVAGAINASLRAFIAIGPAAYIFKYYFWDKVVGAFVGCANLRGEIREGCETFATDGLSTEMAGVLVAVVAFYFVYDMTARSRR